MPYHVDRSKLYVMQRLEADPRLDRQRIARAIEGTRFPASRRPANSTRKPRSCAPPSSSASPAIPTICARPTRSTTNSRKSASTASSTRRSPGRHRAPLSAILLGQRRPAHPDRDRLPQQVTEIGRQSDRQSLPATSSAPNATSRCRARTATQESFWPGCDPVRLLRALIRCPPGRRTRKCYETHLVPWNFRHFRRLSRVAGRW